MPKVTRSTLRGRNTRVRRLKKQGKKITKEVMTKKKGKTSYIIHYKQK